MLNFSLKILASFNVRIIKLFTVYNTMHVLSQSPYVY